MHVHMHAMYVRGKHYSYYIPQAQPNGAAVMYTSIQVICYTHYTSGSNVQD